MEPTVDFIVPYWGDDPYRSESYKFLEATLCAEFSDTHWMIRTGHGGSPQRAAARNALAKGMPGEILVFIDADSIPDPDALSESINHVWVTKGWMLPYRTYYNLTEEGSREFMKEPPWKVWRPEDSYEYEFVFPGPDPTDRPSAQGGCVVVHRDAFRKVNGYDERFQGWGGEDRAFILALETLIGTETRYPASIYHLWHPDPEEERFGHSNWRATNQALLVRYNSARMYPKTMIDLVNET